MGDDMPCTRFLTTNRFWIKFNEFCRKRADTWDRETNRYGNLYPCSPWNTCVKKTQLTIKTKVSVYNAWILSTLLYGNKPLTKYVTQQRRLNVFHMCSLRKLFGISWISRTKNIVVLYRYGLSTMFQIVCHSRPR